MSLLLGAVFVQRLQRLSDEDENQLVEDLIDMSDADKVNSQMIPIKKLKWECPPLGVQVFFFSMAINHLSDWSLTHRFQTRKAIRTWQPS